MKYSITFTFLFFCTLLQGQNIEVLSQGRASDSSLYHITKISDNEFWIAGKHGILMETDTVGHFKSLPLPLETSSILKTIKTSNYVFIITNNATLFRYDLKNKTFLKKVFPELSNKCFYDIILQQNGNLLLCGGNSGISKGKRQIPKGFIASIDQELNNFKFVWRNYRKFVWSLTQTTDGTIMAAAYNGINTKLIKSNTGSHWTKDAKIKGLVYKVIVIQNDIWYFGSRSAKYNKKGIFGMVHGYKDNIDESGCLWDMDLIPGVIMSVTAKGKLLLINTKNLSTKQIQLPTAYSVYSIEKISDSKIILVGHNNFVCIVDFS